MAAALQPGSNPMTEELIVQRLHEGWTLANHGRGWWLAAPRIDRRRPESAQVEDAMVEDMKAQGVLRIEIPHTTAFARLPGPDE
jgi:hypothetical protein